ncbi:MAG: trigger factor [Calditrichaeota bacterium]|nr:trigger factor [Calditrichota bacterium]
MPEDYTAEVQEIDSTKRAIELTFPASKVDPELELRLQTLRKRAKIQGFRPGRVPMSLIKKMYERGVLEDIAEELAQKVYADVLDEHKLHPISRAQVSVAEYKPGEHLKVRIEFEVAPEIGEIDLSKLEVERVNIQVTDKDVETALKQLQRREAVLMNVEDGARPGDIIKAKFRELDSSGVPLVGRGEQAQVIRIPNDTEMPDSIARQLEGVKPGETRQLRFVERGTSSGEGESADRERVFQVEVEDVQREEIPELDDEFAKDVGDFETLDELREHVRRQLEAEAAQTSRDLFIRNLKNELVKAVDVAIPESMLKRALDAAVENERRRHPDRPRSREEIEREIRADVIWMLKWSLIRDHLVEKLGLTVSDDDVDMEIEEMIKANPDRADEIRQRYASDEARSDLRYDLEEAKLLDAIASEVKIRETTTPFYVEQKVETPETQKTEETTEAAEEKSPESGVIVP